MTGKRIGTIIALAALCLTCCATGGMMIAERRHAPSDTVTIPTGEITPELVEKMLEDQRFPAAEKMLVSKSARESNDVRFIMYRGIINRCRNRPVAALDDFTTCLELIENTPSDTLAGDIHYWLSATYGDLGDYADAARSRRNMLIFNEKDPDADSFVTFHESFSARPYRLISPSMKTETKIGLKYNLSFVTGYFNDGVKANILIDTGANMSVISSELAGRLNIDMSMMEGKVRGSGGETVFNPAVVDSLRIGDIAVSNIPVAVIDSKQMTFKMFGLIPLIKIDAVIGTPFLRHFDIVLDYPEKSLSLAYIEDRNETAPQNENTNRNGNFYLSDNLIYLPVSLNGADGLCFMLDTGGGAGRATLTRKGCDFLQAKGDSLSLSFSARKTHGIGGSSRAKTAKDITLAFDDFEISGVDMIVHDAPVKSPFRYGCINNGLLKNFRVSIDFSTMRISFERPERK